MKHTRSTEMPPKQFLRPAQACELFGVGRTFLYTLARKGRLTAYRPSPRVTLYRRDEIERLIGSASNDGGAP